MFSPDEMLARQPCTPDPYVVRPLGNHRGSRRLIRLAVYVVS
jgi:hypothetical protein